MPGSFVFNTRHGEGETGTFFGFLNSPIKCGKIFEFPKKIKK
jgi:hypothetical protein